MESLKLPKSGSGASTPTGKSPTSVNSSGSSNVSVTVRFNAGGECVESIYPSCQNSNTISCSSGGGGASSNSPGSVASGAGDRNTLVGGVGGGNDSLDNSPLQHQPIDDQTNRNNFLQGNFFNRKSRSGSVEGISPTSSGPNLIAAFTSDSASSVGTWKLLKGKVSQTIEDIKLSKSNYPTAPTITLSKGNYHIELDSDPESASLNPSISDDNAVRSYNKQQQRRKHKSSQQQQSARSKELDTDSDLDSEAQLGGDLERSRLRRGLANLKSKVKAKAGAHHHHTHNHHHQLSNPYPKATVELATAISSTAIKTEMSKENSPQRNLRMSFLRNRRKNPVSGAEIAEPAPSEMPEEAIPVATTSKDEKEKKKKGVIAEKKEIEIESGVEMLEDMTPQMDADKGVTQKEKSIFLQYDPDVDSLLSQIIDEEPIRLLKYDSSKHITEPNKRSAKAEVSKEAFDISTLHPLAAIACLSAFLMIPINDFIRGVLAAFLGVFTLETLIRLINYYIVANPVQKKAFKIPDYEKMSILEIPTAEEHTIVKGYSGWMNELNSYDPNNYHVSMTKSVNVRLDGTILRLSSTTAKISKKLMWNEPPIDLSVIEFTDHRVYDLLNCRVELLPIGLARKRYFNRKYPIQLIVRHVPEKDHSDDSERGILPIQLSSTLSEKNEGVASEVKNAPNIHASTQTPEKDIDVATSIVTADLQTLHDSVYVTETESKELTVPRGDEVRLLLFSRGDREKEDWYRRFLAASTGEVHEQLLHLPNVKLVNNIDFQASATKAAHVLTNVRFKEHEQNASIGTIQTEDHKGNSESAGNFPTTSVEANKELETKSDFSLNKNAQYLDDDSEFVEHEEDENYEGLIMSANVSRNPIDYVRFMANYQRACRTNEIPVFKHAPNKYFKQSRKHRRAKRHENDLWRGIDQSLFLGPSGSVVWANVLFGRVIYSCLHDSSLKLKLKDLLQRKLSSVKLPSFMEDVIITQIGLGDASPLVHRISQPLLDERGTWLDADVTYEGICHITVTTKLNLMRLKRSARSTNLDASPNNATGTTTTANASPPINIIPSDVETTSGLSVGGQSGAAFSGDNLVDALSGSAIFDSEAESSGASDSDTESPLGVAPTSDSTATSEGNARRLFKLVDRFAASNLFQYATEISYVQRAIENMNANITLRVDLHGLVGRGVINLPPPPSDRIWLAFRGPPRLWLTAKPTVGDKSVDWSIVTNVIESKLCDQLNKYLVYPNMIDITIPFLGQPTYKE